MTARARLLRELQQPTEWVSGEVGADEREAVRLADAYRAEVLLEAADVVMASIERCDDERTRIGLGVAHFQLTRMTNPTTPKES